MEIEMEDAHKEWRQLSDAQRLALSLMAKGCSPDRSNVADALRRRGLIEPDLPGLGWKITEKGQAIYDARKG